MSDTAVPGCRLFSGKHIAAGSGESDITYRSEEQATGKWFLLEWEINDDPATAFLTQFRREEREKAADTRRAPVSAQAYLNRTSSTVTKRNEVDVALSRAGRNYGDL